MGPADITQFLGIARLGYDDCGLVVLPKHTARGRPKGISHRSISGRASENKEAASDTISASVVERLVDVCVLQSHANGKNVLGPTRQESP